MADEERTVAVRLEMNIAQYQAAGGQAAATTQALEASVARTQASTKALSGDMIILPRNLNDIGGAADGVRRRSEEAAKSTRTWAQDATALGSALNRSIVPLALLTEVLIRDYQQGVNSLRSETASTGGALDALTQSMEKVGEQVPQSLGKVGQTMGEIATRTGQTGPGLEHLTKQILDLGRMGQNASVETVTRVFGDWSIATNRQSGALDTLFRVSQVTGASIDTISQSLVRYGAPLRTAGFSFEESALLMGKFNQEGVNMMLVLSGMRIGMSRFAAAGRDPKEALIETISKIHDMKDQTAATNLAVETFGKRAGLDMVRAIKEGRFSLKDMQDQMKSNHDTIDQAGADTLHFSDQIMILKNRAAEAVGPAGDVGAAIAAIGLASGPLVALVGGLQSKLTGMGTSLGAVAFNGAAVTAVVGGLVTAYELWSKAMSDADAKVKSIAKTSTDRSLDENSQQIDARIQRTRSQIESIKQDLGDLGEGLYFRNIGALNPFNADARMEMANSLEVFERGNKDLERMKYLANQVAQANHISAESALKWVQEQVRLKGMFGSTKETLDAWTESQQKNTDGVARNIDEERKLEDSIASTVSAQRSVQQAYVAVTDAQRAAAKASEAITDARYAETEAHQRVADAVDSYQQALKKERDAQLAVADAQTALNKALAGEDEQLAARDAALKVEDALQKVSAAQAALNKARAEGTGADVAKAQLDLQKAQLDVDQARAASRKADGAQAENVTKAEKALADARDAADQAHKQAVDSSTGVARARRDEAKAHEAVADAEYSAQKASQAVITAQQDLAGKAFDLNRKLEDQMTLWSENADQIPATIARLEELKAKYPEMAAAIDPYLTRLREINILLNGLSLANSFALAGLDLRDTRTRFEQSTDVLGGGQPAGIARLGSVGAWTGGKPTLTPAHLSSTVASSSKVYAPTWNVDSGMGTAMAIEKAQRLDEARLTSL